MYSPLTTERFLLKPLTPTDASNTYLHWLEDNETSKFITYSFSDINDLSNYIDEKSKDENCFFWGIYSDGQHIGNVKYERLAGYSHIATMGILIGESIWHGRGVAAETIIASSHYLSKFFEITHINLGVKKLNTSAIKAYEKIGFEISEKSYFDFDHTSIEMIYKIAL